MELVAPRAREKFSSGFHMCPIRAPYNTYGASYYQRGLFSLNDSIHDKSTLYSLAITLICGFIRVRAKCYFQDHITNPKSTVGKDRLLYGNHWIKVSTACNICLDFYLIREKKNAVFNEYSIQHYSVSNITNNLFLKKDQPEENLYIYTLSCKMLKRTVQGP